MRVTFAHLCDYATISREGKVSVLGIFSFLGAMKFPVQHPLMYLVFEVELSTAEMNKDVVARAELRLQDGAEVMSLQNSFRAAGKVLGGSRPRIPQVFVISNTTFARPDTYQWTIWLNDHVEHEFTFDVRQITPAQLPKP